MSSPIPLRARSRWLAAPLLAALAAGPACATNQTLHNAQLAESQQDYDRAVIEYGKALKEKPDDRALRLEASAPTFLIVGSAIATAATW